MDKSNSINRNCFERWEPIISGGAYIVVGVLAGSTRIIEWVNGSVTKEGIIVTCALNALVNLISNQISKKNSYYESAMTLMGIAMSSFAASHLVSISPYHALIIGLCNGALKEVISFLYKRYQMGEEKEVEGSIFLANNNSGYTGIIGSDT